MSKHTFTINKDLLENATSFCYLGFVEYGELKSDHGGGGWRRKKSKRGVRREAYPDKRKVIQAKYKIQENKAQGGG